MAVTPVPTSKLLVAWAIAPITAQTNGALPWWRTHGCRWSLIIAVRNPASSARQACATRSRGSCSSLESHHPRRTGCSDMHRTLDQEADQLAAPRRDVHVIDSVLVDLRQRVFNPQVRSDCARRGDHHVFHRRGGVNAQRGGL